MSYKTSNIALSAIFGASLLFEFLLALWIPNLAFVFVLIGSGSFFFLLRNSSKHHLNVEKGEVHDLEPPLESDEPVRLQSAEEVSVLPYSDVLQDGIESQPDPATDGDTAFLEETIKELDSALEAINSELTKRLEECTGTLQAYLPVIDIQSNQLLSVNKDTEQAALRIVSGIMEVRQSISEMISELTLRGSANDQAVEESTVALEQFKELQRYVESRSSDISSNLERDRAQLDEIVLTTKTLADYVRSASEVTNQIKILALNTSIVAATVGNEGLGFSVIAKEMTHLSDISREATKNIADQIGRITSSMRIQIQDRLDGQASAGELERTVLGDLEQQFARYVEVVADHAKVIEETNEKNQVLSGKVMDIMAGIQFQDITRQKIEQVIKSLSLLKEQFEQTVMNSFEFATPESEKDLTVDTLFDSYVMNDQRVTHLKTLGNVQDNVIEERSLPTIELF